MSHFYLQGVLLLVVLAVISKCRECKTLQVVQATSGAAVNLSCPVNLASEQQASQNISWVTLTGDNPAPVNSTGIKINGASLVIESVHDSDSGWYRCQDVNGPLCFDVFLHIQVLTTCETDWNTQKDWNRGILIAVFLSVSVLVVITAVLIRLIINCRLNTKRVSHQTQRHPPDTYMETIEGMMTPMQSQDLTSYQVDSLFQQFQQESLRTFHY